MGINYFDTSRNYQKGNNERMVAAGLGNRRKNIVLSTKTDGKTKEAALQELDTSLKELQTDCLDIWYLHLKNRPEDITDELMEALDIARKAGKTRFIGVSTHRLPDIAASVLKAGRMDVVLTQYNFTMDEAMEAAIQSLHEANIGLVAMKVMAGGTRGRNPRPQMQREGGPLAALKWVLKNPRIATTVPSMTDGDQLEQNFRAMKESFGDPDQKLLAARLKEIGSLYCHQCGHCDGQCPNGVPVSDVLRYLMYAEGYGQFALGREHFLELPAEVASVRCTDCPACTIQCPNGVRVTERLIRAQELFA
jgi:predicted aldo/keto reductase-like oxidoreductase